MAHPKSTDPHLCGGTDEGYYKNTSGIINSDDMVLFDVSSVLSDPGADEDERKRKVGYLAFFAVNAGEGTFVYKVTGSGTHPSRYDSCVIEWAIIKENGMPALAALTKELELCRDNGHYTFTHGLPQDYGGTIDIKYADGEKIKISSNQNPVITREAAFETERLFDRFLRAEKVDLPDPSDLTAVRFDETKEDGSVIRAELIPGGDGGCTVRHTVSAADGAASESEHSAPAEVLDLIKATAKRCGMFAWSALPKYELPWKEHKKLTFVFDGGREVTVRSDRVLPEYVRGEFFAVEAELTIKN